MNPFRCPYVRLLFYQEKKKFSWRFKLFSRKSNFFHGSHIFFWEFKIICERGYTATNLGLLDRGLAFVSNQVMLGLFVLAYNLGNFLRRLVLPREIKHWSLRTLLTKLIKIGAKVVRHSRYVTFQMAEVAVRRKIFAEILLRIERLRCCPA